MGAAYAIVPELLREGNYERWKIWMKSYLLGEELWDIVEGTERKPNEATQAAKFRTWRKKNGKALHAIQLSCGPKVFKIISKMDSAEDAWDAIILNFEDSQSSSEESESKSLSTITEESESSYRLSPVRSNDWRRHLYEAVVKGDWNRTESLINSHSEALSGRVLMEETILHTAVLHDHVHIVVELLKKMSIKETEITLPYRCNSTALHLAAARGIVKIAEVLVKKNANLLWIRDEDDYLPITRAVLIGNKAMVHHLYSLAQKEEIKLNETDGVILLIEAIATEDFSFALEIYRHHPQLTFVANKEHFTPIEELAQNSSSFSCGNQFKFWQRWIYNCFNMQQSYAGNSEGNLTKVANRLKEQFWDASKILAPGIEQIYSRKLKNMQALELLKSMSDHVSTLNATEIEESGVLDAMELASEFGNVEFVVEMVKSNRKLLWMSAQSRTIFHVAVKYRRERIWNLLYSLGVQGDEFATFVRDSNEDTLSHAAARLAPSSRLNNVSGPALQIQWELQWFKEVETMVPPSFLGRLNEENETARALFTEQHKDLVEKAEKWMKDTASSCMVMTTLIATVMFAAAFTLPGGNDSQKGIPMFLQETSFMIFIVADALSLFSSTASILMFLSILTSRYAEEDFLKSLPKRMIIGFATLFFSIATMMVAFSATLVIVLHDRYKWIAIPISLLASIPVTLFALLQLPLFVDMVLSTYGPSMFRKQTELLFNSVPAQSRQTQYLGP